MREALDPEGELTTRLSINACQPRDMPEAVQGHDLSVMFFTEGLSKLGSSPTRMAEILGCGLPVIANAGVGDVARIIETYRVGVLVNGPKPEQMKDALKALDRLLDDPDLSKRCRHAAEEAFSLSGGTETYSQLYASILDQK